VSLVTDNGELIRDTAARGLVCLCPERERKGEISLGTQLLRLLYFRLCLPPQALQTSDCLLLALI